MASVRVTKRDQKGSPERERVTIEKAKFVFGRHRSCDYVLAHPTVSRQHFSIERVSGKSLVVDLDSGNGTLVNGARISWIELKNGDNIDAGPFNMIFESDESAVPTTAAEAAAEAFGEGDPRTMGSVSAKPSRTPGDASQFGREHRATYSRLYLEGIEHFNFRRYYEAHEVWEEIWLRSQGDEKLFYQMLIQAAVGLYHYERGNARGVLGMHKAVTEKLGRLPTGFMSLDLADFSIQFFEFFSDFIDNKEEAGASGKPRPRISLKEPGRDI